MSVEEFTSFDELTLAGLNRALAKVTDTATRERLRVQVADLEAKQAAWLALNPAPLTTGASAQLITARPITPPPPSVLTGANSSGSLAVPAAVPVGGGRAHPELRRITRALDVSGRSRFEA